MTGTRVLVRESPGEWVKLMVILSEAGGTEQPASHSPEAGAGEEEAGGYTISWATASGMSDSDRELLLSPSDLQSLGCRFWWASVTSFRYLHSIFFLYLLESGMVGEGERPGDPAEAESVGEALVLTELSPLSLFSWPGSASPNRSPVSVVRLVKVGRGS